MADRNYSVSRTLDGIVLLCIDYSEYKLSIGAAKELARFLRDEALEAERELERKADEERRKLAESIPVDRDCRELVSGKPVTEDHREIDPATGMQKDYVVLCAAERAKGFVRPVRRSYRHVGIPGPNVDTLRDPSPDEELHQKYGYVKVKIESDGYGPGKDRLWTQEGLDRVGKGCGQITTMGIALAETYARDPHFYSGTFCAMCRKHFPVGEYGEFVWEGTNERVGT